MQLQEKIWKPSINVIDFFPKGNIYYSDIAKLDFVILKLTIS